MFNKYISIIIQVIGSSLKIIQAAAWDEIHIFLSSFYKKPILPFSISFLLLLIWQIYMILLAFAHGYGFSITFYRYVIVSLSLFFLVNYYRKLLTSQSSTIFIFVGFGYMIIYLLIIYINEYQNLESASWQDWWYGHGIWAGTAYTAYTIYIIVGLTFILNNKLKVRISILFLAYVTAFASDSRLTLLLMIILTPFIGFDLRLRQTTELQINYNKLFKKFLYFIITLGMIFYFLNNQGKINQQISFANQQFISAKLTVENLMFQESEKDIDRKNNNKAVKFLAEDDILNFIFGSGLTSHQYELIPYMNPSSDGKVRPTGFPAVVFDGGIIYFLIIVLCAITSILKILNYAQLKLIPYWKAILWTTIIFNSVTILFVVNVTDLMLWWAIILSGTISSKTNFSSQNN